MTEVDTAPVMTWAEADAHAKIIGQGLAQIRDSVIALWEGRGWLALGYSSWSELCADRFQMRVYLPVQERRELVADLTARGMSTTAIGPALGVSDETVRRDRGSTNVEPGPTTGLDGKTYERPTPNTVDTEEDRRRDATRLLDRIVMLTVITAPDWPEHVDAWAARINLTPETLAGLDAAIDQLTHLRRALA